jgi:epoxyqueuosine reductase
MTLQERVSALLHCDCAALPLSSCRLVRPYLLEKHAIPTSGTALFFAVPYLIASDACLPSRNLSLYAIPKDYHLYINQLSHTILPVLEHEFPQHRFALFSDHSPLSEVEGAARAGLGVIGENGLLITPSYGSFIFVAEIITSAGWTETTGLAEHDRSVGEIGRCIGCGACTARCPGHCTKGHMEGCLSALTQKKGALTPDEEAALQAHPLVWGCDTCQLVCPLNQAVLTGAHDTPIPFFRENRLPTLTLDQLEQMSDSEFSSRAFAWRGRAVVRRNLMVKGGHPSSHKD